ncbi:MAG: DEAD/DEAH box helicase, partial [Candidatus Gracilibacteria bacterium]|nr:DEAD/DEAH box helicase [Candidatus Gracilibacteria bacterium]
LMIDGIKYEKTGETWDMKRFENEELEAYLENVVEVHNQDKTLYDHIIVDSETIERPFTVNLEGMDDVKFYFKLPSWFKIPTPIGSYNPDWAIVFENDKRIYFVAETKGTTDIEALSRDERYKILCGKSHFSELEEVNFKGPIRNVTELVTE